MEASLFPEAEGVLVWMVKGLMRLKENKWKFSYSRSVEEGRRFYRVKANPVLCWIEEFYTGNDDDAAYPEEAYEAFHSWCEDARLKKIPTKSKFFRSLNDEGFGAKQTREFDRKRVYFGFKCHAITPNSLPPEQTKLENIEENIEEEKNVEEGYSERRDGVTDRVEEDRDLGSDIKTASDSPDRSDSSDGSGEAE